MEKFKGTKGEWKVNGNNIQVNPENPADTESICLMYGGGKEKLANAKLIAAAPELLGALIKMCEYHENKTSWDKGDNGYYKAKQAINKALK